jgi:tetratricopeptide (TPR) repeat protein
MGILAAIGSLLGCAPQTSAPVKAEPVANDVQHNEYVQQANILLTPYMRIHGVPEKSVNSAKAQMEIKRGITLLAEVVAYNPTNWSSWWVMGKGFQSLGEAAKACDAFGRSYSLQRENPDVAREFMFECLEVGRTNDAISAAEHAVSLSAKDAGLHANLALAYTMAGRISDAQVAIRKSLELDPKDSISLTLRGVVEEIVAGRRPQPRTLRELEGRSR